MKPPGKYWSDGPLTMGPDHHAVEALEFEVPGA